MSYPLALSINLGPTLIPEDQIYTRLPFLAALEEAASTVENVMDTSGV
jgi:hypothetical protein